MAAVLTLVPYISQTVRPNDFREHCFELCLDVDLATEVIAEIHSRLDARLATETAIEKIQQQRDAILKQINDYEAETNLIQIGETRVKRLQSLVKSVTDFSREWKVNMAWARFGEEKVAERNESALVMIGELEREKRELISLVYNKKMISFVKNEKAAEMENIGFVKYNRIGCCSLDYDFKKIDIKDILKLVRDRVEVYPQDDGTFYLLWRNKYWIEQLTIDKDGKVILS